MVITLFNRKVKIINMNRNEQELHKDIKRVAIALERLIKIMTKLVKDNG